MSRARGRGQPRGANTNPVKPRPSRRALVASTVSGGVTVIWLTKAPPVWLVPVTLYVTGPPPVTPTPCGGSPCAYSTPSLPLSFHPRLASTARCWLTYAVASARALNGPAMIVEVSGNPSRMYVTLPGGGGGGGGPRSFCPWTVDPESVCAALISAITSTGVTGSPWTNFSTVDGRIGFFLTSST